MRVRHKTDIDGIPLHQHVFSLSTSYPTNALSVLVANIPSDSGQKLIANLREFARSAGGAAVRERGRIAVEGYDPYYIRPSYRPRIEFQLSGSSDR